ncbi:hypothetical protein [Pedobacter sp. JCM 36344]|uniref:hypothetical protein n=1 Tax=Pedobacter sp. JCM 36344 TaxID=3374280 RepID=UPI00397C12EB
MAFLKNIFKKKEGGSFFGNILRGVGSTVAPGVLGTGKGLVPLGTAAQIAAASGDTVKYEAEMKKLEKKAPSVFSQLLGVFGGYAASTPQGQQVVKEIASETIAAKAKQIWLYAALAAAAVYFFVTNKSKKGKFTNYKKSYR